MLPKASVRWGGTLLPQGNRAGDGMARFTCVGSTRCPDAIEACFITLPNASLPFLCVVTKLHFLLEQKNFFKKALVFFCEKCYLVSNRSVSWIQSETTRFPLRHSCCSSFLLLCYFLHLPSYHLPCPEKDKQKTLPHLHGGAFFVCLPPTIAKRPAPFTVQGALRFSFTALQQRP